MEKHGAVGVERAVNEEKKTVAHDAYEKLADVYLNIRAIQNPNHSFILKASSISRG